MKSVSVIIPTLNNALSLDQCLESLRKQNYPQELVEIIVVDGHSKDNTAEVTRGHQTILVYENIGNPEAAKAIGLTQAKNELILQLEADNVLPDSNWLAKMISVLEQEPRAVACYPWRYAWKKDDPWLSRYFALFGANDPVAWFLKKADRQSYLSDKWILSGKAEDRGDYFLVEFNEENLPTVGAKGFLIYKEILMKAQIDLDHFFHMDVNVDLVRQGFNQYAVVKNSIIHAGQESFGNFFKRRKKYMEKFYLGDFGRRRYFVYDKRRDKGKIIAYSFYSLTFIGPVIDALRGYRKIPDLAWFLHPLVCFLMFWIYFFAVIKSFQAGGRTL